MWRWFRDEDLHDQIDEFEKLFLRLYAEVRQMAATLADIQAKVTAEATVEDSVIALLTGISQQLKDAIAAKADPAALQAIADGLDANISKLSAAVTANTPAAPVAP